MNRNLTGSERGLVDKDFAIGVKIWNGKYSLLDFYVVFLSRCLPNDSRGDVYKDCICEPVFQVCKSSLV